MKATILSLGAALLLAAAATRSPAQFFPYYAPKPAAPDACGPGYYCTNPCGMMYGPNYCLRPWFAPYNGERPNCGNGGGGPGLGPVGFPTHPYARSPRDFFMMD